MKLVLLNLILILSINTFGQEIKSLEQKWYADRIKTKTKDLKPFTVDPAGNYEIENIGKQYNEGDPKSAVSANLIVNQDTLTTIRNTEALKRGDTLDILIYNITDASHDHNFQIQIIQKKCFIFYDYSYPMDTANRKLETVNFRLHLNSTDFKAGKKIKGHVEYAGRCTSYCEESLSKTVKVDGNFMVTIQ